VGALELHAAQRRFDFFLMVVPNQVRRKRHHPDLNGRTYRRRRFGGSNVWS
jgi:hypothetical protein